MITMEDYTRILNNYQELQQENDNLKNRLENAVSECFLRLQEFNDLQQRIDKAIEYTKRLREKYFRECVWGSNNDLGELLEILKGE